MRPLLALALAALVAVGTTKGGGVHAERMAERSVRTIQDRDAWVVGRASGDARVAELHELRAGRGRHLIAGGQVEGRGVAVTNRKRPRVILPSTPTGPSSDRWWRLALCESGGNARAVDRAHQHFGAFQFALSTWRSLGMSGDPRDFDYPTQLGAAKRLLARSGRGQWPTCAARAGL